MLKSHERVSRIVNKDKTFIPNCKSFFGPILMKKSYLTRPTFWSGKKVPCTLYVLSLASFLLNISSTVVSCLVFVFTFHQSSGYRNLERKETKTFVCCLYCICTFLISTELRESFFILVNIQVHWLNKSCIDDCPYSHHLFACQCIDFVRSKE